MIAVILFFVVIVATAILLGNWATNLDKKEKELNKREEELNTKDRVREALFAQLCEKEDSVNKKQKDADDAWQKCLEEGQRLMEKQHELYVWTDLGSNPSFDVISWVTRNKLLNSLNLVSLREV